MDVCVVGCIHHSANDTGDSGRHVGVWAQALHPRYPLYAGSVDRALLAGVFGLRESNLPSRSVYLQSDESADPHLWYLCLRQYQHR